nr:flagellar basal body L-ring protein FlgH [Acetobacter pasteurianus]
MPPTQAPPTEVGSLWRPGSRAFFKDQRASQVGDLLTIKVEVADNADVTNDTSASGSGSEDFGIPSLLGFKGKGLSHITSADALNTSSSSANAASGTIRRGFLTLEAISGHFVEFSHTTGARSGILTIFCFWRRVLNAVRVSRPEKAVLVEAMWSVHCLFLQMACRSLRNRA